MVKTKTKIKAPDTPELERLSEHHEDSRVISEFVEWLLSQEYVGGMRNIRLPDVLYKYFDLDANKIEEERRELLLYQRLLNEERHQREELMIPKDKSDNG